MDEFFVMILEKFIPRVKGSIWLEPLFVMTT